MYEIKVGETEFKGLLNRSDTIADAKRIFSPQQGGGVGGRPDSSAAISHSGFRGAAFGAGICPGPAGDQTGRGGDLNSGGQPGYVLLTWGVDRNPAQ